MPVACHDMLSGRNLNFNCVPIGTVEPDGTTSPVSTFTTRVTYSTLAAKGLIVR